MDSGYTSLYHVCGFYGNAILFGSKARIQALSYVTIFAKLTPLTYIHVGKAGVGQKSASAYHQIRPREV
ncbi:protein of unknown function [Methylotuvimicrobium alcaliphilum 20Z]|uniref:Uncharacterized protein n=1 Tax=Methylotuvimicrobium alcaliphilum (strain DSM 19304 / NCIMB 14124 / VKM B-2133 / 20Z) TaxID=1091494 RepID=G4SUD5_META2|nr:protein of unknown function [Methylotuvimicrobium alcaliphilum 20Z]